jgi:hypothetical protein
VEELVASDFCATRFLRLNSAIHFSLPAYRGRRDRSELSTDAFKNFLNDLKKAQKKSSCLKQRLYDVSCLVF